MTLYHVQWRIEIEADSPTEAAARALIIQRDNDPANTATVFHVITHEGHERRKAGALSPPWETIDLSEDPE